MQVTGKHPRPEDSAGPTLPRAIRRPGAETLDFFFLRSPKPSTPSPPRNIGNAAGSGVAETSAPKAKTWLVGAASSSTTVALGSYQMPPISELVTSVFTNDTSPVKVLALSACRHILLSRPQAGTRRWLRPQTHHQVYRLGRAASSVPIALIWALDDRIRRTRSGVSQRHDVIESRTQQRVVDIHAPSIRIVVGPPLSEPTNWIMPVLASTACGDVMLMFAPWNTNSDEYDVLPPMLDSTEPARQRKQAIVSSFRFNSCWWRQLTHGLPPLPSGVNFYLTPFVSLCRRQRRQWLMAHRRASRVGRHVSFRACSRAAAPATSGWRYHGPASCRRSYLLVEINTSSPVLEVVGWADMHGVIEGGAILRTMIPISKWDGTRKQIFKLVFLR